jgi:hypothetical protein
MLADITNAKAKAGPNADPKVLLKQSRESLAAGRFDEAQALASRANASNHRWGVFEDNPTKCVEDLQKARAKAERAEAVRLMADARKCIAEGKLDEAEGMAYRAERLHGTFSVLDGGDRPAKLLGEIQSARGKARKNNSGVVQAVATDAPAPNWTTDMNASSKSEILRVSGTASADSAAHDQAKLLMAEGKSAMRWGRLAEARNKFIEAQNLKADFKPDEENPIRCLNDLMNLVNRQLREAAAMNCSATDTTAAKEACAERLMHARQLAMDFNIDTRPLDAKLASLNEAITPAASAESKDAAMELPAPANVASDVAPGVPSPAAAAPATLPNQPALIPSQPGQSARVSNEGASED